MKLTASYYTGHTLDLIETKQGFLWTIVNDWFLPILAMVGITTLLILAIVLLVGMGKIALSMFEKDTDDKIQKDKLQ